MKQSDQRRMSVLLGLRRRREDVARVAFESARVEAQAAEAQVQRLRSLLNAQNAAAREAMVHRPASMSLYRQAAAELTASLADANRLLAATRAELERRRKALHEAMQDRKAAESVNDKRVVQVAAQQYRLDTKAADDMHAARSATSGTDSAG